MAQLLPGLLTALVDAVNGSSLVEGTLLLALCSLSLCLPGATSATRHGALALGLFGLLLLPLLAAFVPAWSVELAALEAPAPADAPDDAALPAPALVRAPVMVELAAAAPAGGPVVHPGETATADLRHAASTTPRPVPAALPLPVAPVLLSLWGAGAIALLVRLLVGRRRIARIVAGATRSPDPWMSGVLERCRRKMRVARTVALRIGDDVSVPFVRGILRPEVALPSAARAWPRARLESVLLHELGHVRRLDEISLVVGRAATALYWFHPLVWRAERAARRESERACDDMVLALGTRPSDYASHLLDLVRTLEGRTVRETCALAAVDGDDRELESRISAIVSPTRVRRRSSGAELLLSAALLALGLAPIASIQLLAKPLPIPHHAKSSYEKGMELHGQARYDEAIAAFEESARNGERIADATYNVACGRALQGDADGALRALVLAVERGFAAADLMKSDPDLATLHGQPRFEQLVAEAEAASRRAAEAQLAELRAAGEVDAKVWEAAGSSFLMKRELPEAIEALEQAAELAARAAVEGASAAAAAGAAEAAEAATAQAAAAAAADASDADDLEVGDGLDDLHVLDDSDLDVDLDVDVDVDIDDDGDGDGDQSVILYNLACAHALAGHEAQALDTLEKAVDAGWDDAGHIEGDEDLASLRGERRFTALVERLAEREREVHAREAAEARAELEALVHEEPDSGEAWYQLALVRYEAADFAGAAEAFERSAELGHREGTSAYNAACSHALAGKEDAALGWLQKAASLGFDLEGADEDPDLASLRDDPRFRELVGHDHHHSVGHTLI